jgi:hypothetical protein
MRGANAHLFAHLVLFEDARKQAKELDEEFGRTGKLRGPLHGVPMSFKDQCTLRSSERSYVIFDSLAMYAQMKSLVMMLPLVSRIGPTNRVRRMRS